MGLIQLNESGKANRLRVLVAGKASRTLDRLHNVPNGKNLTYWSAAVLAFLIAPIAALSLSAKPGAKVNLESSNPSISNSESVEAEAPSAQDGVEASVTSGSAQNSNSSSVESNVSASVNVNGQEVEVPKNGNVNETIVGDDGQTTHVIINSSNSSTNGDKQKTSSKLRIRTDSNIRTSQ